MIFNMSSGNGDNNVLRFKGEIGLAGYANCGFKPDVICFQHVLNANKPQKESVLLMEFKNQGVTSGVGNGAGAGFEYDNYCYMDFYSSKTGLPEKSYVYVKTEENGFTMFTPVGLPDGAHYFGSAREDCIKYIAIKYTK